MPPTSSVERRCADRRRAAAVAAPSAPPGSGLVIAGSGGGGRPFDVGRLLPPRYSILASSSSHRWPRDASGEQLLLLNGFDRSCNTSNRFDDCDARVALRLRPLGVDHVHAQPVVHQLVEELPWTL